MPEIEKPTGRDHSSDLQHLYPSLTPGELEAARGSLRRYVALALRVLERIELDPEAKTQYEALTASRIGHRIIEKRQPTKPPKT
jgi:hypothetical protein